MTIIQRYDNKLEPGTFLDAYTFTGGKVSKAGSARWADASDASEPKIMEVFWSEQLSKVGR